LTSRLTGSNGSFNFHFLFSTHTIRTRHDGLGRAHIVPSDEFTRMIHHAP